MLSKTNLSEDVRLEGIFSLWCPTTYPMNLSGHPDLSLPYGTSSEGLPIGMQLYGSWYSEGLLLGVPQVVEEIVW